MSFFIGPGLALEAVQQEKLFWKVRPKYHKLLGLYLLSVHQGYSRLKTTQLRLDHIVFDQSQYLSPVHASCYNDEDGMGKIKNLARITNPRKLGLTVLLRWTAYVCVRWVRMATE